MPLEVTVEKLVWRGKALAKTKEEKIILISPPCFPQEQVLVEIYKEKKDFCLATC